MADSDSALLVSPARSTTDFEFGDIIGEGSYSIVLQARETATGRSFAVKVHSLRFDSRKVLDKKQIVREKKTKYVGIEKQVLQQCQDHPSIVTLFYTFQDTNSLYFVLELAPNGNLLEYLQRNGALDVSTARFYTVEICMAVAFLHDNGILHRDLKPENVLLADDMHIRLTDFGSATILSQPSTADAFSRRSFVGTAEYCSPELLNDRSASPKSDIWAIACILFQLLVGRVPFKGGSEYLTFQLVLKVDYTCPGDMDTVARNLVERILVLNVEKRLGFTEIRSHMFFSGINWNESTDHLLPIPETKSTLQRRLTSSESIGELEARLIDSKPSSFYSDHKANDSSISLNSFATVEFESLLKEGEVVVQFGLVLRKKLLRTRKYMLILTTFKRLLFADPKNCIVQKEYLSLRVSPVLVSNDRFEIRLADKSYILHTPNHNAPEWIRCICSIFNLS